MKMNMRKNRFWTLSRQAGGFTLVELIVVIAILAILAGVAVPVYSGYIKRANRVADEQLLADLNTAFASACLENGVSNYNLPKTPAITLIDGKFTTIENFDYNESFAKFFDIASAKFTVFSGLIYMNGAFFDSTSLVYGNIFNYIKENFTAQIGIFKDSTYNEMGIGALMNQLNDVTDVAVDLGDSAAMLGIVASPGFADSALAAMNVDPSQYTTLPEKQAALMAQQEKLAKDLLTKQGIKVTDANYAEKLAAAKDKIQANAIVLYTAQSTQNKSASEVQTMISSATKQTIVDSMKIGNPDGLAQAALMCGLYTSYINSGECKPENKRPVDADNVLEAMDQDADFQKYLQDTNTSGTQGYKDLQAYLSALQMLNSVTTDPNATENLMVNGFADKELIGTLDGLLG